MITFHLRGGSEGLGAGKMAAQVGANPDGGAAGWFEAKVWVETGDAIDLEKRQLEALSELMMQAAGPFAQAFRPVDNMDFDHFTARLAARYCNMRKTSIYAGSNEIQRNIIAKAVLGL